MAFEFGPRRGVYIDITKEQKANPLLTEQEKSHLEKFDLIYRSLCAMLYNYVPTSGHPGGSISSGRFVQGLIFKSMDYDFSNPDREEADIISYGAGHKALGLYALWALRNEIVRVAKPDMLPKEEKYQLRLEDLLGFRRNPINKTPLFLKFKSKPLDGHPTPATPFLKLSTGASGVGVAASLGLAFGALDYFGEKAPKVHIVEGEGGMTPGRVAEGFASAGTSSLSNAIIHVDWNQASIDSNRVCRDGQNAGDYVQWTPAELAYLNDWNVIYVPDGKDYSQILSAQLLAKTLNNGQPTAIVYKTIKGWMYGIEGRASHGAGHKMCSEGFFDSVKPLLSQAGAEIPKCEGDKKRCDGNLGVAEECFWSALTVLRKIIEADKDMCNYLAGEISESKKRLDLAGRRPRASAPELIKLYDAVAKHTSSVPAEVAVQVGTSTTLRGELGKCLNFLNKESKGALLVASADLLGSTNISDTAKGISEGFFNSKTNAAGRILSIGGICEDAMSGVLAGISTFGKHIGIGSSYAAFLAPLGHIPARLHAIGSQARQVIKKEPYKPFILICAHTGLKTGEDGPTHADPQALQTFQENFAGHTAITLTPWDPQEIWPLLATALSKRPAVLAPFVTRPNEKVLDRQALGLAPASETSKGVYKLIAAKGKPQATVVLQESGVTYAFLEHALPLIKKEGLDLNVYYVSSVELFDALPVEERNKIFCEKDANDAIGITGFTKATMFRWVRSDLGQAMTMHPFQKGHYLGSGQADMVLEEAGLDGESQFKTILKFVKEKK